MFLLEKGQIKCRRLNSADDRLDAIELSNLDDAAEVVCVR